MGAKDQGADAVSGRWMTIPRTLSFVTHQGDILLMKRSATRRVFPGRYNGLGGHLERDEDPYTGAIREIREESGLDVHSVRLRGICNVDAGTPSGILLFVFTAEAATRDVTESSEGSLHWVSPQAAQNLPLVEDLPILLPRLFGDTSTVPPDLLFFAHVHYDPDDRLVMKFAEEL